MLDGGSVVMETHKYRGEDKEGRLAPTPLTHPHTSVSISFFRCSALCVKVVIFFSLLSVGVCGVLTGSPVWTRWWSGWFLSAAPATLIAWPTKPYTKVSYVLNTHTHFWSWHLEQTQTKYYLRFFHPGQTRIQRSNTARFDQPSFDSLWCPNQRQLGSNLFKCCTY